MEELVEPHGAWDGDVPFPGQQRLLLACCSRISGCIISNVVSCFAPQDLLIRKPRMQLHRPSWSVLWCSFNAPMCMRAHSHIAGARERGKEASGTMARAVLLVLVRGLGQRV
jgi:hypothetical protein